MDIRSAEKIVLKSYPGYKISQKFKGIIAQEEVFGFFVSKGDTFGIAIVVYTDGTIVEAEGPVGMSMFNSFEKV